MVVAMIVVFGALLWMALANGYAYRLTRRRMYLTTGLAILCVIGVFGVATLLPDSPIVTTFGKVIGFLVVFLVSGYLAPLPNYTHPDDYCHPRHLLLFRHPRAGPRVPPPAAPDGQGEGLYVPPAPTKNRADYGRFAAFYIVGALIWSLVQLYLLPG